MIPNHLYTKNIWGTWFFEIHFSSFQLKQMFVFLTDYQKKSIKLLWGKCWGLQISQSWNACFVAFLVFAAKAVMSSCFSLCHIDNILLYLESLSSSVIFTISGTEHTFLLYGCRCNDLILGLAWCHIKTILKLQYFLFFFPHVEWTQQESDNSFGRVFSAVLAAFQNWANAHFFFLLVMKTLSFWALATICSEYTTHLPAVPQPLLQPFIQHHISAR